MGFMPSERSRASTLLGFVKDHMVNAGDVITYDELAGLLDLRVDDVKEIPSTVSGVIARVNKRLHLNGDWRHLSNIPTVGYRVASPDDLRTETIARQQHMLRTHLAAMSATSKTLIHPDSTPAVRKQAADARAHQDALAVIMRKHNRQTRKVWPAHERSIVVDDSLLNDDQP